MSKKNIGHIRLIISFTLIIGLLSLITPDTDLEII